MEAYKVLAQNIKCDGCVAKIKGAFEQNETIKQVEVNKTTGEVIVSGVSLNKKQIDETLKNIGHPIVEQKNFFSKLFSK